MQKAEAELAYELQAAKTKQRIKDEQMQIKVVERTQEILVQVIETQYYINSLCIIQRDIYYRYKIISHNNKFPFPGTRDTEEGEGTGFNCTASCRS